MRPRKYPVAETAVESKTCIPSSIKTLYLPKRPLGIEGCEAYLGAEGGSRTPMRLPSLALEASASTIPPPRLTLNFTIRLLENLKTVADNGMAMLNVTELRKGAIFVEANRPYVVLEYQHVKVGRGNATIKVKVRDLKSGSIFEKGFNSGARVEEGEVTAKKAQYLYSDPQNLNFMDPTTFEQFTIPAKLGDWVKNFLKEGAEVMISLFENEPVSVNVPLKVDLKVVEAPPANRGDTRQGGYKEVILETGYKVSVPLFVKDGDILTVNTETGYYVGRA